MAETVNKLQHTCWCAFTFFLRWEVDVWNCCVPVFEQTVRQQQSEPNRLYYSNKANSTQTEQIVLQQQSKLNRLANICVLSVENLLDHVEDYSLGFVNFCFFVFNQKNIQMCPRMAVVFVVVVIMF